MDSPIELIIRGQYDAALEAISKGIKKDHGDDLLIGKRLDFGVTLVLAKRYGEARHYFDDLIARCVYTVDAHFNYRGLIEWYATDDLSACLPYWQRALKAQYCGDKGLQTPLFLSLVATKCPKVPELPDTAQLLRTHLKRAGGDNLGVHLAKFLLGKVTAEELLGKAYMPDNPRDKKRMKLRAGELARIAFYVGVSKLKAGDGAGYRASLVDCLEHSKQSGDLSLETALSVHGCE